MMYLIAISITNLASTHGRSFGLYWRYAFERSTLARIAV